MIRKKKHTKTKKLHDATASGFTIVETMLVLAISGLLLVGIIGSSVSSITHQRYMDALRGFAEYVRTMYSEAISPQSLGTGNSDSYAILGKVIVFGADSNADTVYSATIVGKAEIPRSSNSSFMEQLADGANEVRLFCGNSTKNQNSTVASYTPLWQAELMQSNDGRGGNFNNRFTGTLIIARAPTSAAMHTAFLKDITYNLKDECTPTNSLASTQFVNGLSTYFSQYEDSLEHITGICVKTQENPVSREIQIAADGHNTSAVHIMDDNEENRCR